MRKRILSMLLACSLVLALVPVMVYADRVYCSVCGKFKDVTLSDYVYADGEYHQQYATCNGCGKIYSAGLSKHSGSGTATCDTGIKCDLCGGRSCRILPVWELPSCRVPLFPAAECR